MKNIIIVILGFMITIPSFSQNKKGDEITGKWVTENNQAKVEIYKVNNKYYGKIIWLKEPNDKKTGKPQKDKLNPDIKLKERAIIGMVFISGFSFNGKDEWEDGSIYDANSGKTYNCNMNFESSNKIKVRGYIGKAWMGLGKTTYWSKTN